MPVANFKKSAYRRCVGVVMFNAQGKVWVGKRAGEDGPFVWQFPQGGIDAGEPSHFAALRELYEETGTNISNLKPLGKAKDWLYYDFPEDHKSRRLKNWAGQRQRWYAYRYTGKDADFNLNMHEPAEFTQFKWVDLSTTPEIVVPFKRKVYEQLALEFEGFAAPAN